MLRLGRLAAGTEPRRPFSSLIASLSAMISCSVASVTSGASVVGAQARVPPWPPVKIGTNGAFHLAVSAGRSAFHHRPKSFSLSEPSKPTGRSGRFSWQNSWKGKRLVNAHFCNLD